MITLQEWSEGVRLRRRLGVSIHASSTARARAGQRNPNDYLFVSTTGKQLSGSLFRGAVKWTETSSGHTIHDLRHYAASTWLRAGIPVHQVAKWLGHANPATTLRVYAHVLGEGQDIAAIKHLDARRPTHTAYENDSFGTNLSTMNRDEGPSLS